jgi:xanthine dehydrogenase accessory factor
MESIYDQIVRLYAEGQPFALGTVVYTTGSTPQKIGARAVFLPGGEILGTLGGGCMEAEARRRGLQMVRGGDAELLELHLDDDFGWDDGLICGGIAHILIQPKPVEQDEVYRAALQLKADRGRGVFALITVSGGNALGRAVLVRSEAPTVGDLGDPALQTAVEEAAHELLQEGREEPRRLRLRDIEATVYLEPLLPRPVCFIAGAGHIGAALSHYAARCGFEVAIVDDRPSLCNAERLPDVEHVLVGDIVETVRAWPKTPDTYFIIVTRGHRHDAVVLREVVKAPLAYLGMIGSKRKILTIYDEFVRDGLATPDELARIHAPIGLDIGALTVDEIALCIAAELVLVRRQGSGRKSNGAGSSRRDCPGGGEIPADGDSETALAVRQRERDTEGRPLPESLPRRAGARGAGTP